MKVARYAAVAAAMVLGTTMVQAQAQDLNCTGSVSNIPAPNSSACRLSHELTTTVPTVARLSLTKTATTLTGPVASDFVSGAPVLDAAALQVSVLANANYTVTAQAASQNFLNSNSQPTGKPASDLELTADGNNWASAAASTPVLSGGPTTNVAAAVTIGYRTKYSWSIDAPGTYKLVINYTLTAP